MSSITATAPQVDRDALLASVCRDDYFSFIQTFWHTIVVNDPVWNWHVPFLAREAQIVLERVFAGKRKLYDIVTNQPPGTSKSSVFSIFLLPWAWTRMPSFSMIGASYSEDIALDLSVKSRDIVRSDLYRRLFPDVVLRSDQDTKSHYANTVGGWRYAVGVKGAVTGRHADAISVDDPLNPEQAASELELKTANRWIGETLSTRKKDKAVSVTFLTMQRLDQDDPSAAFLRRGKVRHINLPAVDGPNVNPPELREFYKAGLLDPIRLDRDVLSEYEKEGEQFFAAQFLMSPVPPGGSTFRVDKLKWGIPPERYKQRVRYWDIAGTSKKRSAWTVGTLMGLDFSDRYWVLDVVRGRYAAYDREQIMRQTAFRDGEDVKIGVEQEPGSGGLEQSEAIARHLAGFRVFPDRVDASTGGKERRASVFAAQVNAGNVYLPASLRVGESWVGWAKEWVDEHRYFPFSRWKDQVDSSSGGARMLFKRRVRIGGII